MITKKHATYALIAIAAIGVLILLWFGLHQIAAAIALFFGGGAKALQKYAKSDIEGMERNASIEQQAAKDQARVEWEAKADLAAAQAKEEQRKRGLLKLAAREAMAARSRVNGATTQADLDAIEDKEYQALNAMLPPDNGQDGYIRGTVCAALILFTLCLMAISGSFARADQASPTEAAKARTLQRIKILQRARHEIKNLRERLEFVSEVYEGKIKAQASKYQIEINRLRQLRESDQKTCAAKLSILNTNTCPPCWPHGIVAAGATLLVCGVGLGIREATRP